MKKGVKVLLGAMIAFGCVGCDYESEEDKYNKRLQEQYGLDEEEEEDIEAASDAHEEFQACSVKGHDSKECKEYQKKKDNEALAEAISDAIDDDD